ncbi:MAG: glycosyltransferase [Bacteroidia bacterium]|nr:glycosyltransferase [Bacteroidia bacterium]
MPSRSHKTKVAFSVTNCICHDQRVLKIAETVSCLGCEITIIGRKSGGCCDYDSVPFRTRRFKMLFKRGFLFYKFYNIRLFFYLLFHKYDILVSNDLDTLLPNFIVSRLKKLTLVYDSHEYFTGVPEIQNRPLVKWVWKSIEKMIFPRLKHVMTVNDSIASLYENEYGIRLAIIRNCSRSTTDIIGYSRYELGISKDHLLLIYQGTGINIDRGVEELIEAVHKTGNVSLLVVGAGDNLEALKTMVKEMDIAERVKFIPKLQWKELIRYTKSADAGISLDKNTNLNYKFSLPNKLFDYISAGIPVIASDLTEVKNIILENRCGMIIPEVTPEEISKALIELRDDRCLLSELKKNSIIASESVNWENESSKVVEFYNKVIYYNG